MSWLASPILIITATVLVTSGCVDARTSRWRFCAVAAGFSLLDPLTSGNRTSGGAVLAGLGYGPMSILQGAITGSDSQADEKPVAK